MFARENDDHDDAFPKGNMIIKGSSDHQLNDRRQAETQLLLVRIAAKVNNAEKISKIESTSASFQKILVSWRFSQNLKTNFDKLAFLSQNLKIFGELAFQSKTKNSLFGALQQV